MTTELSKIELLGPVSELEGVQIRTRGQYANKPDWKMLLEGPFVRIERPKGDDVMVPVSYLKVACLHATTNSSAEKAPEADPAANKGIVIKRRRKGS